MDHYPLFQGNPFLEFCFWEKATENFSREKNDELAFSAALRTLRLGQPNGQFYHELGVTLVRRHSYLEARGAFLRAGSLDTRFVPPQEILNLLNSLEGSKNHAR